ncbi:unnamed protein product [Chrysoparadoxa australica]
MGGLVDYNSEEDEGKAVSLPLPPPQLEGVQADSPYDPANHAKIKQERSTSPWVIAFQLPAGEYPVFVYLEVPISDEFTDMCTERIRHFQDTLEAASAESSGNERRKRKRGEGRQANGAGKPLLGTCQTQEDDGTAADNSIKVVPHGLDPDECPHISLCKTLTLRYYEVEPFLKDLKQRMTGARQFSLEVCSSYTIMVNEEKSRSFLSLNLGGGSHHVLSFIHRVDSALACYGKPTFYDPPHLHCSIASVMGDVSESVAAYTSGASEEGGEVDVLTFDVAEVVCKVGQKVHRIPLLPASDGAAH